jgi:peptide/nickel transport system substrate-binding protein
MKKVSRREFLYMGAATAAGAALVACQPKTVIVKETVEVEKEVEKVVEQTVVVEKEVEKVVEKTVVVEKEKVVEKVVTPTALPSAFGENPTISEMVAAGTLPGVDERLPTEPLVVYPHERPGDYGGYLQCGTTSPTGFTPYDARVAGLHPENWLRISPDLTEGLPNTLKGYDMSADFKTITCFMRKGMKWSDGEPLTSDDFMFWYNDMLSNEDITPVPGTWFRVGGKLMDAEKVDDYTFRMIFHAPNPSFVLVNMAHLYGMWDGTWVPEHYCKQFHANYNPKAQELAEEAGRDFWYQWFGNQRNPNNNIEIPVVNAYMPMEEAPENVVLDSNPYFFMMDTEGNQIPYVDGMIIDRAADLTLLDAKTVSGQYDFAGFQTNIQNYATYNDGAAQGNYRILLWPSGKGGEVVYNVNMNYGMDLETPDPLKETMREVFSDVRFRRALSLAMNRAEINEVIYFGNAVERQMTVIPASNYFKQEYADAWMDYDPDQANALLDELGLEWNDAGTHRTWPTGEDIVIAWDFVETETPKGPISELVREYWKDVGIELIMKSITRSLLTPKIAANEEPMSLWHGDETADTLFFRRPKFFAPLDGDESCWGALWGRWYNTQGEDDTAVEPPPEIKDLYDWLDKYAETGDAEWCHNALESQAENIWTIGTVGLAPQPLIVRNTLRNVAETGFWTWDSYWSYPTFPEQWFFEGGQAG